MGELPYVLKFFGAINYLDISYNIIIEESIIISEITQGGFDYPTLLEMDSDHYSKLVKEIEKIISKRNQEMESLNNAG